MAAAVIRAILISGLAQLISDSPGNACYAQQATRGNVVNAFENQKQVFDPNGPLPREGEPSSIGLHLDDHAELVAVEYAETYPNCVSHDPGHPRKPLKTKPGDINRTDSLAPRYCMNDCERAGNPHEVAWWARCSINKNYSAWFVGGGTPWILPRKARPRTREDGTWGLDYDGLFRPRRVWMSWSEGREQSGLGAYETDGELPFSELFKKHD